ncbi:hypothetical protein C8J56DRAFT_1119200 [Mycena floridula]|nr:hypothetical protein C8J56DRAFT_1119200 [Mycena floridula]
MYDPNGFPTEHDLINQSPPLVRASSASHMRPTEVQETFISAMMDCTSSEPYLRAQTGPSTNFDQLPSMLFDSSQSRSLEDSQSFDDPNSLGIFAFLPEDSSRFVTEVLNSSAYMPTEWLSLANYSAVGLSPQASANNAFPEDAFDSFHSHSDIHFPDSPSSSFGFPLGFEDTSSLTQFLNLSANSTPSIQSIPSFPNTPVSDEHFFLQDERYDDLSRSVSYDDFAKPVVPHYNIFPLDDFPMGESSQRSEVEKSIAPIRRHCYSNSEGLIPPRRRAPHTLRVDSQPPEGEAQLNGHLIFQFGADSTSGEFVLKEKDEEGVKKLTKQAGACLFCRKRKVKCLRDDATEEDPRCVQCKRKDRPTCEILPGRRGEHWTLKRQTKQCRLFHFDLFIYSYRSSDAFTMVLVSKPPYIRDQHYLEFFQVLSNQERVWAQKTNENGQSFQVEQEETIVTELYQCHNRIILHYAREKVKKRLRIVGRYK